MQNQHHPEKQEIALWLFYACCSCARNALPNLTVKPWRFLKSNPVGAFAMVSKPGPFEGVGSTESKVLSIGVSEGPTLLLTLTFQHPMQA